MTISISVKVTRAMNLAGNLPVFILPTILASGLALWYRYHYIKKKKENEVLKSEKPSYRVLFFPDEATARSLTEGSGRGIHEGSLSILMRTLQNATKSIDVCMFTFSCKELGELLISAHQNGIKVRVVTDKEQVSASGSQVERLRRAGIQVRHDYASYFMHHKFAVVDQTILVGGSLNWTLQGICGNQENVVILNVPEVVEPFATQFDRLWIMFDPEQQNQ